jgi:predicted MFS family arabinose efflux permease
MAFAASQVLGIPVGLYLATHFDWHAPFLMIAAIAIIVGVVMDLKGL